MSEDVEGERKDHVHHASFWFTHGEVNGNSFWHQETTKHREFKAIQSGKTAKIVAVNDWIGKDGNKVLEDERTIEFGALGKAALSTSPLRSKQLRARLPSAIRRKVPSGCEYPIR